MMNGTSRPRKGLTLFEVLLALAIFLVSLAALAHLIANGTRAAVQGRLQTEAIIRCESKMAEVVAGAEAMEALSSVAFTDDPKWIWDLSIEEGPWPDLRIVQVAVSHVGTNPLGNTSSTLRRYVRDPRPLEQEEVHTPVEVMPLRSNLPPDNGPDASQPEDTDR
jgi:type II secretion system protein I